MYFHTLKGLVAHLECSGAVLAVVHMRWTGKRHETDTYRFAQAIPLCDAEGALEVNWCELTTAVLILTLARYCF